MAFWYIMSLVALLMPLTMIGFGLVFMKNPPKRINDFYGYLVHLNTINICSDYFRKRLLQVLQMTGC